MKGTDEEVRQRRGCGWPQEGGVARARHPGRVRTPTPAWGLGAPGMEVLTLARRAARGLGSPIKQRGDCSPGRLGGPRLGRLGGQVLPLPPVTEAAPPVTTAAGRAAGRDHHGRSQDCLSGSSWERCRGPDIPPLHFQPRERQPSSGSQRPGAGNPNEPETTGVRSLQARAPAGRSLRHARPGREPSSVWG